MSTPHPALSFLDVKLGQQLDAPICNVTVVPLDLTYDVNGTLPTATPMLDDITLIRTLVFVLLGLTLSFSIWTYVKVFFFLFLIYISRKTVTY